jgi:uncharacterized protein YcaQ
VPTSLTTSEARRTQIAAQGLARRRPTAANGRHVTRMLDEVGLLQIDSVNVLARAHLLPGQARLGDYPTALLDRAAGRAPRRLVETFCHEASLVPPRVYALLAGRRERVRAAFEKPGTRMAGAPVDLALDAVADTGPITASALHDHLGHERAPKDSWGWNYSPLRDALVVAWRTGRLAVARRNDSFEQVFDLPERVLPPEALAPTGDADVVRELTLAASVSLGVATAGSLADYHRQLVTPVKRAAEELVESGDLVRVDVDGWRQPGYLSPAARIPSSVRARALLAPFDPLVFDRGRLLETFGMHYRIAIYTPRDKRTHGYYVLPFLLGEHLVARVDLKADRAAGALLVREAHAEDPAAVPGLTARRAGWPARERVVAELAAELRVMAGWLGLSEVVVPDDARGDLATPLATHRGG